MHQNHGGFSAVNGEFIKLLHNLGYNFSGSSSLSFWDDLSLKFLCKIALSR